MAEFDDKKLDDLIARIEKIENQGERYFDRLDEICQRFERDLGSKEHEIRNDFQRAKETFENARQQVNDEKSKLHKAVRGAQVAASAEGFARHIQDFQQAESDNATASTKWLLAAVAAAALTVITILCILANPLDHERVDGYVLSTIVSRVLLVSGLLYIAAWCGRHFNICRHNAVQNRHRASALATYEAFIQVASSVETADAILLEATRYVFTNAQSGYLGKSEETPIGQVLELAKVMTKKET